AVYPGFEDPNTGQYIPGREIDFIDQLWLQDGFSYGVQINIPILNGFNVRNTIKRNKISVARAKLQLQQDRLQLETDVSQAYVDVQGSFKSYQAADKTVEARRTAYQYAQERLNVGVMHSFDYSQAQARLDDAEATLIQTSFEHIFRLKLLQFDYGIPLEQWKKVNYYCSMSILLHIETSTTNCSVSVSDDSKVVALKEQNDANYSHAENLHLFIIEVLSEAGYTPSDLDAICVSKGPGSYTGLRIGVSAGKGMCFALDKPLIAIDTLEILARQYNDKLQTNDFIVPVNDARGIEVYSAVYNSAYEQVRKTEAEVIDPESFEVYLKDAKVHFIGDGAEKCKGVITHP